MAKSAAQERLPSPRRHRPFVAASGRLPRRSDALDGRAAEASGRRDREHDEEGEHE